MYIIKHKQWLKAKHGLHMSVVRMKYAASVRMPSLLLGHWHITGILLEMCTEVCTPHWMLSVAQLAGHFALTTEPCPTQYPCQLKTQAVTKSVSGLVLAISTVCMCASVCAWVSACGTGNFPLVPTLFGWQTQVTAKADCRWGLGHFMAPSRAPELEGFQMENSIPFFSFVSTDCKVYICLGLWRNLNNTQLGSTRHPSQGPDLMYTF